MTNYTKITDFAVKDGLALGNPVKVIKGTEINTELVNVQAAVNSKANSASPTFTGTVTAAAITVSGALTATLTGNAATASKLVTAGFSIEEVNGKLTFKYGSTTLGTLDSSGNLIVSGNVTGFNSF